MPQSSLQPGLPLIVMVADSAQKVIYVHEEMQKFLDYPISGCYSRNLSEVIWDIAEQRLNFMTDERNAELFFSRGGEEYRLTFQRLDSCGTDSSRKLPLCSKRIGTGKGFSMS